MKRKKIILIAPHSMCQTAHQPGERICDKNAWNGLVVIEQYLVANALPYQVISRPDVPRSVVDVNR